MKNTLENEMFDAAVSWCCSNGINVLEPEQLASLVNSLYITVRDADPTPANLVLVPLRPTRAMQDIFQQDDWQWADVLAAAESVTEEQYLFALEDDQQAQPEPATEAGTCERGEDYCASKCGTPNVCCDWYVAPVIQQAQPERAPSAWVSQSGDWTTTSKVVAEHHESKGQKMTPLYK